MLSKKQAITIIAGEETYINLATFDSIDQLNNTVRKYKEMFEDKLNNTSIAVLELLHNYSTKYTGLSFLSKKHIGELVGKSRRTVIRVCKQLEELGIIRQYEMKRPSDQYQTVNAIVIQPIQKRKEREIVTQESVKMSHQENKISLKQNINNNHLNVRRFPYIKFVPKSLQHFQAIFGGMIKDLYGRVNLAVKKLNVTVEQDLLQRIGFIVMEQLKKYIKNGTTLNNDQLCKLAYKIAFNQIKEHIENGEIADFSDFYHVLDKAEFRLQLEQKFQATNKELDELGVF